MDIALVGLNHRTAPLEVRERLAFAEDEIPPILPELRALLRVDEVMVLSTCNRTEVMAVRCAEGRIPANDVLRALCRVRGRECFPSEGELYEFHDEDATRHVFRVAAGLDSMVLGEPQVLGQVRHAYAMASKAGTTGLYINAILRAALRLGKRVRTETELGYGAVSVAYVAVALARKVFGEFQARTALIIGAGETAEAAAMRLKEQEIGALLFVNRTLEKAEQLALALDGEALPLSELDKALERADVVISSTSAPNYILTHDVFHRVMDKRHTRPVFLIDLAVPRDFDPAINDHDNAFLYDIDSLQQVADQNLARRRAAVPAAEKLVNDEMENHRRWREGLKVEPLVKLLYERFDSVRRSEVEKNMKRFSERQTEDLEKLTLLIQRKLLHRPSEILRQCDPETEEGQRVLEVVRNLFDLK